MIAQLFSDLDSDRKTTRIIAVPTMVLISHLKDVDRRDVSRAQTTLLVEVVALHSMLSVLELRASKASPRNIWYHEVGKLAVQNGPLDQFKSVLKQLETTLVLRTAGQMPNWIFEEQEIKATLNKLERPKRLDIVTLAEDHLYVARKMPL
jgi:hypothetical protein